MNKTHRVVWSEARQAYIVAHEKAAFGGRPGATLALSLALLLGLPAHAAPGANELPTGGTVVSGSATISVDGARMDVLQTTQRTAIDWATFNIGGQAHVHFEQPSGGVALNRVLDTHASQIYGRLTSTGQVFLVNPNGVFFAPGAQVDVGGFVASTLNISNADFMAGNYTFAGTSSNAIINQGNIKVGAGGTAALIAARIENTGSIEAPGGNVLLGAGSKVTLDMGGPVKIQVEEGALNALIEQGGAIKADGGLVYLTAKAAGDLASTVINHTGITEAKTLATGESGRIYLMGGMDHERIVVGGTLDASAPSGGDGGFVETSAANVQIADGIRVSTAAPDGKTGEWLIDPVDITIAASGGNISGSTIATALQTTSVTLDTNGTGTATGTAWGAVPTGTNGDIFVNDNITVAGGSASTTLTLKANRDIIVDAGKSIYRTDANALNVVLWADSDATGGGSIYLKDGSSISTNGGHLWMGGGSGSTTWNGLTVGDGYALAGTIHSINSSNFKNGISLYKASISTSGGNVWLYGKTDGQSGATGGYMGVYLEQSSISSGNGNIDLSAISTGSNNDGSWHYGLLMGTIANSTSAVITSSGGTINITGETSFSEDTHGAGVGLYSFGNAASTVKIQSTSGAINVTGKLNSTGFNGQYGGIFFFGSGQEMITSQTGNISLVGHSSNSNVASINVATGNTTSKLGYDGTNAYSGNITLNANTFINYEGAITANNLNLLGTGVSYTLTNTGNDIASLTANTGNVTYLDSNELSLGAITVTGKLNVATATGDLTVTGNLQAGSTASDAVVLNAGKNAAAGTEAGGNIIISGGSVSGGAGSTVKLFSGGKTASTGLDTLVSNAGGTFTYNSDETSTLTLPAGTHAIYRGSEPPATTNTTTTSDTPKDTAVSNAQTTATQSLVSNPFRNPVRRGAPGVGPGEDPVALLGLDVATSGRLLSFGGDVSLSGGLALISVDHEPPTRDFVEARNNFLNSISVFVFRGGIKSDQGQESLLR